MTNSNPEPQPAEHATAPPRVSVVIPVRNDAVRLERCLAALEASTCDNFEVVVVDDASTDETPEVAESRGARVIQLERQSGPAVARNRGAEGAAGEIVVFIDADVCVLPDTVARFAAAFESEPGVSAVFGSYDDAPAERNLFSQYKNLLHHYTHQTASPEASTFWTGCGAIRRATFLQLGGFNTGYKRPCIEDIELGTRLRQAGHRILLDREIQATHLKRWTLRGMVKADVFDRAIPWTMLILQQKNAPNDLNLKTSQRLSGALSCLLVASVLAGGVFVPWLLAVLPALLAALWIVDQGNAVGRASALLLALPTLVLLAAGVAAWFPLGWWVLLPAGLLAAVAVLNAPLLAFFSRMRGPVFAAAVLPVHVMYFVYSTCVFAGCMVFHICNSVLDRGTAAPRIEQQESL